MIIKAALILIRKDKNAKKLMFVRAKGKNYYVFPGGKQESNETIEQSLKREIKEELDTEIKCIKEIGITIGHTPNDEELEMHLYTARLSGEPAANSEIEEIAWMSRFEIDKNIERMTPMTMEHVLPFLEEIGIF